MTEKESHHDMKQTRKQGEHGSDQAVETHKHYVVRRAKIGTVEYYDSAGLNI